MRKSAYISLPPSPLPLRYEFHSPSCDAWIPWREGSRVSGSEILPPPSPITQPSLLNRIPELYFECKIRDISSQFSKQYAHYLSILKPCTTVEGKNWNEFKECELEHSTSSPSLHQTNVIVYPTKSMLPLLYLFIITVFHSISLNFIFQLNSTDSRWSTVPLLLRITWGTPLPSFPPLYLLAPFLPPLLPSPSSFSNSGFPLPPLVLFCPSHNSLFISLL